MKPTLPVLLVSDLLRLFGSLPRRRLSTHCANRRHQFVTVATNVLLLASMIVPMSHGTA